VTDQRSNQPVQQPQSQLFDRSRIRFAIWYAGVMGAILTLLGLGVYRAIAHAHKITADSELKSVAESLHRAIEPTVNRPEQLSQIPSQILPDVCVLDPTCLAPLAGPNPLNDSNQYSYYIRIVAPDKQLLATAGIRPIGLPIADSSITLNAVEDQHGQAYHQLAIPLHNNTNAVWGYLQVGRSFRDIDRYLTLVRWCLSIGFLFALAFITFASWWLSALAMRPIYQSYQQIQQFTGDAAHELRTPLAAIQATVESVLRAPHISEDDAQETLTVIGRQNQRLTTLVSDLLLLSRFDSEQPPTLKQRCCLPDILNDIAEEMAAFAMSKEISLSVDIQTQPQLSVMGNEEQLYRLVLNLVNNALTYTPAGGQVMLSLKQQQQEALISVEDTGIGIAPEGQDRIFDRFYRVDRVRSRKTGNAGLGLAIAQAIAKAHHGTLSVTSQLGAGSTFTISLSVTD